MLLQRLGVIVLVSLMVLCCKQVDLPTTPKLDDPPTPEPQTLQVFFTADTREGDIPFAVEFVSHVTGGTPPYGYRWLFGDGEISALQNPIHTYMRERVSGLYEVRLTVVDVANGIAEDSMLITVHGINPIHLKMRVDAAVAPVFPPSVVFWFGLNSERIGEMGFLDAEYSSTTRSWWMEVSWDGELREGAHQMVWILHAGMLGISILSQVEWRLTLEVTSSNEFIKAENYSTGWVRFPAYEAYKIVEFVVHMQN